MYKSHNLATQGLPVPVLDSKQEEERKHLRIKQEKERKHLRIKQEKERKRLRSKQEEEQAPLL
ncbi:MAG: hypothetical protein H6727_19445 [Myxococcales bacterium]|nr:hypothetical protein [Myxococcales bacterium]